MAFCSCCASDADGLTEKEILNLQIKGYTSPAAAAPASVAVVAAPVGNDERDSRASPPLVVAQARQEPEAALAPLPVPVEAPAKPNLPLASNMVDGSAQEWDVTLQRAGNKSTPLGFEVRELAGQLVVFDVDEDAKSLMKDLKADQRLKAGDALLSVNGVTMNASRMKDELLNANRVDLKLRRTMQFRAQFAKSKNIGLVISKDRFHIKRIDSGLAADYNKQCDAECTIQPGDTIMEVNGVRGSPKDLHGAVEAATVLLFVIKRPDFSSSG